MSHLPGTSDAEQSWARRVRRKAFIVPLQSSSWEMDGRKLWGSTRRASVSRLRPLPQGSARRGQKEMFPPPPRRAVNCDPAGLWGSTALPPTVLGNGSTAPLHTPLCTLGSPLHGCVPMLCPCLHHTVSLSHCMCVFVAPGGTQCMSRSPLHIWFPLCMCVSPCARGMPVSPP